MLENLEYLDLSLLWTREQHSWLYLQPCTVRSEDSFLVAEVSRFVIAIESKDFDPEKYRALSEVSSQCAIDHHKTGVVETLVAETHGIAPLNLNLIQVLKDLYRSSGNTVHVLEAYLSVFATGQFQGPQGRISFDASTFDAKNAELNSPVRHDETNELMVVVDERSVHAQVLEIVRQYGTESVLIWAAVLLKKRVLIVSDQPLKLLATIRVRRMHPFHARKPHLSACYEWSARPACTLYS
jgi:hypothetical protein